MVMAIQRSVVVKDPTSNCVTKLQIESLNYHSLVGISNIATKPVAYFLDVHKL